MKQGKSFEQEMLDKYPNLYKPEACHICKADLRYLNKIHRVKILFSHVEWYCDKCYKKYGDQKNEQKNRKEKRKKAGE